MFPKKKASRVCCVVECKNNSCNSPGTQFYKFSTREYKKLQREKWINAVKRKNPDGSLWQPKFHTRICSRHFIGNRKSEHPLSPSYIPTIFSSQNCKTKYREKAATERFERGLKRQIAAKVKEKSLISQAVTTIKRSLNNSNEAYSDQCLRNRETQVDFLEEPSDCKEDKSCETSRNAVSSDPDLDERSFRKYSIEYEETPCISNIYLQIKTEPQEMECNIEDLHGMIAIKEETSMLEYQLDRVCKPEPSEDPLIGTPCHSDINSDIKIEAEFKVEDLHHFVDIKD